MIFFYLFAVIVGMVHGGTGDINLNEICYYNDVLASALQLAYDNLAQFYDYQCHDNYVQNGSFSLLAVSLLRVAAGLSSEDPPYIYEQLYSNAVAKAEEDDNKKVPDRVHAAVVLAMIDFLRTAVDVRSETVIRVCCGKSLEECYASLEDEDSENENLCPGYSNHVKLHTTALNLAVYLKQLVDQMVQGATASNRTELIGFLRSSQADFREALIASAVGYQDLTTYNLPCMAPTPSIKYL